MSWGGKRDGSGRPISESTVMVRVPESMVTLVKGMIQAHKGKQDKVSIGYPVLAWLDALDSDGVSPSKADPLLSFFRCPPDIAFQAMSIFNQFYDGLPSQLVTPGLKRKLCKSLANVAPKDGELYPRLYTSKRLMKSWVLNQIAPLTT